MTIPSNEGKERVREISVPFSKLSTGWNMEQNRDFPDPEIPLELQEETVTSIFTTSDEYPIDEKEGDVDCPLLQKAMIDDLPPRFQRLLNDLDHNTLDSREGIAFFPSRISKPPCLFLVVAAPFVMGLVGVSTTLSKESTINGGVAIGYIMAVLFAWVLVCIGLAAYGNHKTRLPLFAKDKDGDRKPWPGNWKIGIYLVGKSALLDFDGEHAWLFPAKSIMRVDHFKLQHRNSIQQTIIVLRLPPDAEEETFHYELKDLDEPRKGKDIQNWHRRCYETTTSEV
mmetsp:Transcript_328/g.746  ORF Transcript_328/g.746 Transcript_328/m.746 type:complete len:283 (-) Transcript_328:2399-3247(-)